MYSNDEDEFKINHTPVRFNELVFCDDPTATKLAHYAVGRKWDHLLLHGVPGTGKTVCARTIVRELQYLADPKQLRVVDYNRRTFVSFDDILNDFGMMRHQVQTKYLYVVINEVDQLGEKLLYELQGFLDDVETGRLIMTTNHPQALSRALQSRCDVYEIKMPTPDRWLRRAQHMLMAEGVTVSDAEVEAVLQHCGTGRDIRRNLWDLILKMRPIQPSVVVMPQPAATVLMPSVSATASIVTLSGGSSSTLTPQS
jgi:replication-associated recombination protein RarA